MEKSTSVTHHEDGRTRMTGEIRLPAPTVWPLVLALGITLLITGMVTHWVISALGLVLTLRGAWGWAFEVLPQERHIFVPVQA
ncbi:MAG: cytochrome c oxidase subunit 4, partial [Gammaproteobacteria bacterium]